MASPGNTLALLCLSEAARAGDALAAIALSRRGIERLPGQPRFALDKSQLEHLLQSPPGIRAAAPVQLSARPRVLRFDKLLTREECDYVIGVAGPQLHPSTVTNPATGAAMQHLERTSSDAMLSPYDHDLAVHCINLRLSAAAGMPVENGELLSVLRYEPGQEYRPHVDYFGDINEDATQFETAGQRVRTLLVYLNDAYDGGQTHFLSNGLKVKGTPGDAIVFHNVDGEGEPDPSSRHAGLPVQRGAKWLISKWFRERAYRV
jgi:prolyl 4-hydroxylase